MNPAGTALRVSLHFRRIHLGRLLPVVACMCTVFATLTAVTFGMGIGANATPAEIRALNLWMASFSLLGVAAGIFLMRAGQPGYAAGVAFLPAVIVLIVGVVAVSK